MYKWPSYRKAQIQFPLLFRTMLYIFLIRCGVRAFESTIPFRQNADARKSISIPAYIQYVLVYGGCKITARNKQKQSITTIPNSLYCFPTYLQSNRNASPCHAICAGVRSHPTPKCKFAIEVNLWYFVLCINVYRIDYVLKHVNSHICIDTYRHTYSYIFVFIY